MSIESVSKILHALRKIADEGLVPVHLEEESFLNEPRDHYHRTFSGFARSLQDETVVCSQVKVDTSVQ